MTVGKNRIVLAGILATLTALPALASGSSQGYGEGGRIRTYLNIVAKFNASGALFRIEGVCKSACTLFLGIRNVCVERSAALMFHAGHDIQANVTGPQTRSTRIMLNAYNPLLRAYLVDGHHLDTSNYHVMSGGALIDRFRYPECGNDPRQ
jgi:hypothetical protein